MATFTIDLLTGNLYLFSGNFSGSGSTPTSGSTYPQVNLYADLPSAASAAGQIYVVRTGSGAYVLNRKPSGFYFSTGAVWRFLGDTPDFFKSNNFQIYDSVDTTKGVMFTTSGISTNTFRKLKVQNSDGTIAYLTDLNTKLDTSAFADYTGTTVPNTYYSKTEVNGLISGFTTGNTFIASGATKIKVNGDVVTIYSPSGATAGTYLKLNQTIPEHVYGGAPKFDAINLNTGYTKTGTELVGTRFWDAQNHTTSLILENGITLQDGQELHIYGKNISGSIIRNGQPVSVTTTTGQWTAFGSVDITTPAAYAFVGLATQEFAINDFGYVTINGLVRDINTDHLVEGMPVYVNITGGTTSVFPTVPNYVINVGMVERKHVNHGRINVITKIVSRLEDLSDVNGTSLSSTGQIPVWNNIGKYFDFNYNINNYLTNNTFTGYTATTYLLIQGKQDTLIAGTGISIVGNTISVTGSTSNSALQLVDLSGNTQVNNVSATPISWTQEFTGTSLNFTGGSRIYIQATGKYEISYVINLENDTASAKNIGTIIRRNGNTDITPLSTSSFSQNLSNNGSSNTMPSYQVLLPNGSYIELMAFRIGTTGNVYTKANGSWLKIIKI